MNPLAELLALGYHLEVDGKNIRYFWKGQGDPPVEKSKPLLFFIRKHKEEILQELLSETKPREVSHNAFLQVKAIEAEAFAKGWLPEYLWRPRFVNLKDRLHECGLVYIMEPGEVIKAVTERFIETVNKRGTILRFYKPPKKVKHETNA